MTSEEYQYLWTNLPDVHKSIEDGIRYVLLTREDKRIWVPLKEISVGEFCYLKAFAWAQAWKKKRETRDRIEREKAKKR